MCIIVKKDYPPRTHNLLELAKEINADEKILKIARELTPEFVISRYPDAQTVCQQNFTIERKLRDFFQ